MRIKKYVFQLFFITLVMLPLIACMLGLPKPEVKNSPTLSATSIIPANTVTTPMPSPTLTLTATPPITVIPTATVTLFYDATATPTPQWSACPGIVITPSKTRKGTMLHVRRCDDGLEYDLGPIANGVYAVGPNDRFLVYVSVNGLIFAARIGERYLTNVFDLDKEHIYTVFNKKVTPDFKISFAGDGPFYTLVLVERFYDQKRVYDLPVGITQ